jgi:hypothetical protein
MPEYTTSKPEWAPDENDDKFACGVMSGIEGITDTHYTFEGLTSSRYTYRVKAIAKERESAWSNRVTASDPTGIESITLDQLDPSTIVNVFSTSGQLIRKTTIANWSQALPRGTYILRTKNRAFKTAK